MVLISIIAIQMRLTDILDPTVYFDTVICYNKSSKYFTLMLNLIKKKYKISSRESFMIQNLNELKGYEELLSNSPLYSSHWLIYIEDAKLTGVSQEIMDIILRSKNLVLVVGCTNYGSFVRLRNEKRWKSRYVELVYSSMLTKAEFEYIYGAYTSNKNATKLNTELKEFIQKRYLREVEEVFNLLASLRNGIIFKNKSDIVSLIGVGNLDPDVVLLSLLNSKVKTERGLKMFMKNFSNTLIELSARSSVSGLQKTLISSCKSILATKQLLSEGILISGIHADINIPAYKDNKVSKLHKMSKRIESVSTSKIVMVLDLLYREDWNSELDIIKFLNAFIISLFKNRKGVI